jgi:DUF2075 family protein
MIIYEGSCKEFVEQSLSSEVEIGELILERFTDLHIGQGASEVSSWNHSLPSLAHVLKISEVPPDSDIGIEYNIRGNRHRIDAMVCGKDGDGIESAVVVELKQWSTADRTNKPYFVHTIGGAGEDDYWHPSYQAANYVGMIENFYAYVQDTPVRFKSCSYLHNMDGANIALLGDVSIYPQVRDSPVFLKGDEKNLADFISHFIKSSCKDLLYRIDHSSIKPSPKLSDMLRDALQGKEFFSYSDEQADAVSTIVQIARDSAKYGEKRTVIVRGRPGTGKSIVAINVLGQLVAPQNGEEPLNSAYFTCNSAPRQLYKEKLIDNDYRKNAISNLFKNPLALKNSPSNAMACSLFDEAHRMFEWRGGKGLKKGVNLMERCINASKVSVFFIDEDQAVTIYDYANIARIKEISERCGSKVVEGPVLKTQFRVLGGSDYLEFIRSLLGYPDADPHGTDFGDYDFRVFDSACDMRNELKKMNDQYGDSRMVAGYTYEWITKKDRNAGYDIVLDDGDFKARWNMSKQDYSWLYDEGSFEDVGCIHTCQGLDMQYCGVIIGKDLRYEDEKLLFDKTAIAKSDQSSGIRRCDPEKAKVLIRNTYNVLLTRGMRGTFVYCEDKKLREAIMDALRFYEARIRYLGLYHYSHTCASLSTLFPIIPRESRP